MNGDSFDAWKSGDSDARWKAWEHYFRRLWTWLVCLCSVLARNPADGEIWADEIWRATFDDIETKIREGRLQWMGADRLGAYIRRRLRWRALDRLAAARRAAAPARPCRRAARGRLLIKQILQPYRPAANVSPGVDSCATPGTSNGSARRRVDVLGNLDLIDKLRGQAIAKPALLAVLDAAERYLWERFALALPDGIDPAGMTWPVLARNVVPERLGLSTRKRSLFITEQLGISRNRYYLRVRRLRGLLPRLTCTGRVETAAHVGSCPDTPDPSAPSPRPVAVRPLPAPYRRTHVVGHWRKLSA